MSDILDDPASIPLFEEDPQVLLAMEPSMPMHECMDLIHKLMKKQMGILNGKPSRSPCNFLVFGLGYDSLFWATLNYGGRTVFLEEDEDWIAQIARKHLGLKAYHVQYSTAVTQADDLLAYARFGECRPSGQSLELETSTCKLALRNLLPEVYNTEWDAIISRKPLVV